MRIRVIIAIAMAVPGIAARLESVACAAERSSVVTSYQSGPWLIRETENFRICTLPGADRPELAQLCESLRRQLQQTWFNHPTASWSPKCDIVLYRTVAEYRRILGPGSEQSSGCASLELNGGRVVKRRVDLRADAADWLITALPHELTHVIVADRFSRRQLPRWADEGMAILAEPEQFQAQRTRALNRAVAARAIYQADELVRVSTYPEAMYRDAFYGQSASLVGFLIERESPQKFLEFVERAMEVGYDQALANVYNISSTGHLQALWQPRLHVREATTQLISGQIRQITSGAAYTRHTP